MTLEPAKDIQANSPDNQPKFQQLIIPGMEEFLGKNNTQVKQKSCTTPLKRQGFKDVVGELIRGDIPHTQIL
jgi:hypothetical protein